MFLWPELKVFSPVTWGEVQLKEGTCRTGMILEIKDREKAEKELPLPLKAVIIQQDGYKAVAFRVVE